MHTRFVVPFLAAALVAVEASSMVAQQPDTTARRDTTVARDTASVSDTARAPQRLQPPPDRKPRT